MIPDLDQLYNHESAYYRFASNLTKTDCTWYLSCPDLPESREVNRALRLRDDGRGPDEIVQEVVAHFRKSGVRVSAEIDAVSEAQGIGAAFRRRGITPVIQSRSLMTHPGETGPELNSEEIRVVEVDRSDASMINQWIETNLHDVELYENAEMWRKLTTLEAQSGSVRLFLGRWSGQPTATCSLFQTNGMGRIEMVETRTEYRRRGLGFAIVARAALESVRAGDKVTYLYTSTGSDAEGLYKRLGFEVAGVDVLHRHIEA